MKLTLDTLPMYCTSYGQCLLWDQSVNSAGYPQATLDGIGGRMVRRYVYSLMGKELQKNLIVSPSCGQKLCVSPDCLEGTRFSAVLKRSYKDGARSTAAEYCARLERAKVSGMAKLTPDQVADIRSRAHEGSTALASEFAVAGSTIRDILRGKSWRTTSPQASVFTWGQRSAHSSSG